MSKKDKGMRNWLALFTVGTINNLAYSVVLSASKSLAEQFGKSEYMGLFSWCNVLLSFVMRVVVLFLENSTYTKRLLFNTALMLVGISGVAASIMFDNFFLSLFFVLLVGGASSFGECVILGFLRQYPRSMIGAWSSGTGMAGLGASMGYLLLFDIIKMPNLQIFLILLPLVLIYAIGIFFWLSPPITHLDDDGNVVCSVTYLKGRDDPLRDIKYLKEYCEKKNMIKMLSELDNLTFGDIEEDHRPLLDSKLHKNEKKGWARYKAVFRKVLYFALCLSSVYFFEYAIIQGGAKNGVHNGHGFWVENSFEILQVCYQAGVLVSRSSLSLFKLREERLWVPSFIQGINFILWMIQDEWKIFPLWILYVHMVFVGLMGGLEYVQVFAGLKDTKRLSDNERELANNTVAMWITIGISLASIYDLVADNILFK
ncbi:hypothetical protein PCE1_001893 [Barthelona sp. PCE]